MGRKITQRSGSYSNDASAVLRIARAIEQDATVTPEWRAAATARARELVTLLLSPGIPAMPKVKKAANG